MKLYLILVQLFLIFNFNYVCQANLLPDLPDPVNLFKQFADLMKNGFCGIDLEAITHDPDEKRSTVKNA